ncbi:type 1 glutamine amidotransferase [Nesterenkonia lacusekhoensis]|uniref:Lipid II isoglutaminyl synthase (glutamine-hydrolyzing) subunit GatD n=1 Tax=Nesterenkonia lacusekhoensis TaxID=150832 RepID=A0ABS4T4D7_9MICC|nr:glutamine amidotransferase [Nesterenkonia lacusekhoensis]MBP2319315.1 CobQ-like glutamine amidotransferase family enzyme [Nesterenkonia lacusekhoensis]
MSAQNSAEQTPGAGGHGGGREDRQVHVLQLYPRDMNIYGDYGNALVVQRRLEWLGYEPVMHTYDPGDEFPEQVDIIIGGGGQDSGQDKIHADLLQQGERLRSMVEDGVPMLMICGLYQLFGHSFETREGQRIEGIGALDVTTRGTDNRLIGNVVARSEEFGEIIGYENHSGQTYLGSGVRPLGTVTKGEGNNEQDDHEGARYKNVVGSYLHGSMLPKNPAVADFLISTALQRRFGEDLSPEAVAERIDDTLTEQARTTAAKRPR